MGTGFSTSVLPFPTEMVDCKTTSLTVEYSTDRDARREYACTSDPKLRWPMTISHLLIMAMVFLVTFLIYSVYMRLLDRRLARRLKNTPNRLLPVGRDVVSRNIQQNIFDGFANVFQDYAPSSIALAYYHHHQQQQPSTMNTPIGKEYFIPNETEAALSSLLWDAKLD